MNFPSFLFLFLVIPFAIFSQTNTKKIAAEEKKFSDRVSVIFYLENTDLSRNISTSYVRLIAGGRGYTVKDTARANKLIKHLYQFNEIAFYRFMRIRLEWEFKQRLQPLTLDSAMPHLKNNIDSSFYYYTKATLFKDSMEERIARRLGFVRVNYTNEEIPDWKKIKTFRWDYVGPIISLGGSPDDKLSIKNDRMKDSAVSYYRKSIEQNPNEFQYLKELAFFLVRLAEEALIKQFVSTQLNNYTDKEKVWLKEYLADFYTRQKGK